MFLVCVRLTVPLKVNVFSQCIFLWRWCSINLQLIAHVSYNMIFLILMAKFHGSLNIEIIVRLKHPRTKDNSLFFNKLYCYSFIFKKLTCNCVLINVYVIGYFQQTYILKLVLFQQTYVITFFCYDFFSKSLIL